MDMEKHINEVSKETLEKIHQAISQIRLQVELKKEFPAYVETQEIDKNILRFLLVDILEKEVGLYTFTNPQNVVNLPLELNETEFNQLLTYDSQIHNSPTSSAHQKLNLLPQIPDNGKYKVLLRMTKLLQSGYQISEYKLAICIKPRLRKSDFNYSDQIWKGRVENRIRTLRKIMLRFRYKVQKVVNGYQLTPI